MLKSLTARLKTLIRRRPAARRAEPAGPARVLPRDEFVALRARILAGAAPSPDEVELLRALPADAEAHVLQAELALAAGDAAGAVPALERALALSPGLAEAHEALGRALAGLGRSGEAVESYQRAIGLAHDCVPAHVNLGRLYEALGRAEDAADCFHLALALDGAAVDAELGIGRLMRAAGHPADSVEYLQQVVTRNPSHATAVFELARSLNQAGDTPGAIAAYEHVIALSPGLAETYVNLGLIHLSQLGDARRAEDLFLRAIQLAPAMPEAQANLGLALQEQGRIDEALKHYEKRIQRWPGFTEFRWNRGIARLAADDYERGWDDFELRKVRPDAGGVHQKFGFPDWDGAPLAGRAILVYGEQGLGDEIMFGSCLPEVVEQAGLCVVECDARLAGLYRRSFPRARVEARGADRARDWRAAYPALELQSAVGSLPRYLRRRASDFPVRGSYLVADAAITAAWRARLDRAGASAKIGISWRGGTSKTRAALRSLMLDDVGPLLDRRGAVFVVLQRGLSESERAALAGRASILVPEIPRDIDEQAGLLSALDLVVTVDNTNVHLAGALGRPVWALLPPRPEWRYGAGGESGEAMPWYRSVRTFRRRPEEAWAALVARVSSRLDAGLPPAEGRS